MDIYVSDKEQIEMIKKWWRENGKFTILSISAALLLSSGWRYWQNIKNQEAASASVAYEQMLNHQANHQVSEVEFDATSLITNHPKTPYASLAALISAQNAINKNKLQDALEKLNWIITNSKNVDFKQTAQIRKARVLKEIKKFDEALSTISQVTSKAYLPLINEVRGDILLAQDKKNEARISYQNALHSLPKDAPNRSFLQMKFEQLSS